MALFQLFLYARLQTGRIMVWWCPSVRPSVRPGLRPSVTVFHIFLLHALRYWAEILCIALFWCTLDQVWMSSISVNFCWSYAPFQFQTLTKYAVFRTFLLHALTYWAEILHMTLFNYTTDQVRVSSISVNFCRSYAPFGTWNTGNTQFSALFSSILWHIELKFYTWLCFTVLQIKLECRQFASIFVEVMPLLGLRKLEIHSFPHFSLTCFDILSWNFSYDFVWCAIYQVRVPSLCVRLAHHPSIHFLHFPPTCIDRFIAEI